MKKKTCISEPQPNGNKINLSSLTLVKLTEPHRKKKREQAFSPPAEKPHLCGLKTTTNTQKIKE